MSTDGTGIHRDWHDLAERASIETDPKKLEHLIQELCDALDRATMQRAKPIRRKNDAPVDE